MSKPRHLDDGSLLLTLEETSRLVSHSHDPHETLTNIVRLIRDRFQTAVCSVYLLEPGSRELVLGATVGLKPDSVGRVRMRLDEGLTGMVAEKMAPVMVEDAFKHPRFKYFPEAGEDPYHAFLGVPLLEGGALEGVLVVQTVEPRSFSPNEMRMLLAVAAQVASLVGDAHLLEMVVAAAHQPDGPTVAGENVAVEGVSLSPGAGLGAVYIVDGFDEWRRTVTLLSDDPKREKSRLADAMEAARSELLRLSQRISELVGEDHGAILQAQLMIMQDRAIERDLTVLLDGGASAEGALFQTLDKYVTAFQKVATPFFQERVYDIKDVFHRLLWQLRASDGRAAASSASGPVVLVAHEASVMELFAVDPGRLAGVVVEHGSPQSHAAILARTLGIPMVGQVPNFSRLLRPGRRVLVDGSRGAVYLDPSADFFPPRAECAAAEPRETTPPAPPVPGLPRVEVNVNLLCEVEPAVRQGASGVGLYRSEFLFLARRSLPTEEEQVGIYRKLLVGMDGRPVGIRTFDLRPDKLMTYSHLSSATARPFDWRLVLDSPPLRQLFREQVRAILRAGAPGPGVGAVRVLIPLVTRTELLDFVLETFDEARRQLSHEGMAHTKEVSLGIMIEVAAAAAMVDLWADRVDYFALGTNDLTASALGLEREDPVAAGQCDPLHPGLLRLINEVVYQAHAAGRPVTVCGEMAADPLGCLALVALEIDSISVPVNQLRAVQRGLASLQPGPLRQLAPQLTRQRTASKVREFLRSCANE